jgi:hypothetical protein
VIRNRQVSDEAELLKMYDGSVPTLTYERVMVEDGQIVAHAGIRMVPEAVLVMKPGHPAARMNRLRALQTELLGWLNETGYRRIIALVAPKIERGFLRRLRSLGWEEGMQSAIFLAEGDKCPVDRE